MVFDKIFGAELAGALSLAILLFLYVLGNSMKRKIGFAGVVKAVVKICLLLAFILQKFPGYVTGLGIALA